MSTEANSNGAAPARDCRVILAGRTGLDSELRFDPRLELIRVRSALEAIGELSDPIDEASPAEAVVVVGPDADPSTISATAAGDFVEALRRVDPGVRVLRARPGMAPVGADIGPYDGDLRPGNEAETILEPGADAGNGHAAARPLSGSAAEAPEEALPEVAESTPARPVDQSGDAALVRMLISGEDPLAHAMELLRERTGVRDLRFLERGDRLEAAGGAEGTPVVHRDITLGMLVTDSADAPDLASGAAWLADWIVLRDQHAQLRTAAFTDPLTGAWNRRYLDRFLSSVLQRARDERRTVTVMVFDIDDFKNFNDEFSHAAGDEILIHTVKLLKSVIRPTDRVCRIGGDEFVVVFFEPEGPRERGSEPPSSVFEIARRFQRQICEHRFPKLGDQAPGTLTISGGMATFPWDGRSPEELIEAADELALKSKRQGKNALTLGPGAARVCDLMG